MQTKSFCVFIIHMLGRGSFFAIVPDEVRTHFSYRFRALRFPKEKSNERPRARGGLKKTFVKDYQIIVGYRYIFQSQNSNLIKYVEPCKKGEASIWLMFGQRLTTFDQILQILQTAQGFATCADVGLRIWHSRISIQGFHQSGADLS